MKIDIASPCKRSWASMKGDDVSRFCGDCKLNVYNLSSMTEEEGRELLKKREGRVCVRFYQRPDGTVLTRDCPVGVGRKRRAYGFSMAAAVALFSAPFAMAPESCAASGEEAGFVSSVRGFIDSVRVKLGLAPTRPTIMMGDVGP